MQRFIQYRGILAHSNVMDEMRKMHLLILRSPYSKQTHYGFSTKLAEYMASGVPVLGTDVSDNKLYITDNVNGFLLAGVTEKGFYNKFKEIIDIYAKKREKLAEEALRTTKSYFDYRNYSDKLTKFLFYGV